MGGIWGIHPKGEVQGLQSSVSPVPYRETQRRGGLAQVLEAELDSVAVPRAPTASSHAFAPLSFVVGRGQWWGGGALVLDHGSVMRRITRT